MAKKTGGAAAKPPKPPKTAKAAAPAPAGGKAWYEAARGRAFSQKDANVIGPELAKIAKTGGLVPAAVVDHARDAASPLHRYFEWDDERAGEKWREQQAREMIQSVVIHYEVQDDGGKWDIGEVRAFHPVTIAPAAAAEEDDEEDTEVRPVRAYVDLHTVVETAEYREQVIDRARREFLGLKAKYEFYRKKFPEFAQTFGPLWEILDQLDGE